MISIFTRTIIIYVLLLFCLKVMGKRQIGELEVSELVSTLLISEIASLPITEPDIPLFNALIPILFIVSVEIILSFLKNRSKRLKRLIEGEPVYLIYRGKIRQSALTENRLSLNELMCEMRMQGIFDIESVDYALLEQSGNISFMKGKSQDKMTHPVIIDADVKRDVLKCLGYDDEWLMDKLKERKVCEGDVFLMTVSDDGNYNIIKKEEK